ncbi:MAG: hypothetical protein ACE366_22880 [Bradymonadia bacterium]
MARPWQFITHRVHGVLDMLVDVSLVALAVVAWQQGVSLAAAILPGIIGVANLLYSMLTTYALGRKHLISFPMHLGLDAAAGVVLLAGGALFSEAMLYRVALMVMGGGILGAVALTNPEVSEVEQR